MRSTPSSILARNTLLALLLVLFCTLILAPARSQSAAAGAPPNPQAFDTPQEAVSALIQAAANYDVPALVKIFGPEGEDFVSSADPVRDQNYAKEFASKAREKNEVTIDPANKSRATLSAGNDGWPFPVPLVKNGSKWHFDAKQGHDEILHRRIGANELDAIQVCRGFVEAQEEYATEIHDNSGVHQYAQKIISTPGKQDGLFWRNADGTPGGPISEAVANAIEEGYSSTSGRAFHGYYFKVLTGQGPAAPLGKLDYVIEGAMIGGFALVAVPAEYRVTGVKTFMVSYDGVVYQKDLGADSLNLAKSMVRYNPDKTWHPTYDQWPADVASVGD